MLVNLIMTEVETLANFKHHLHTSSCDWQARTETVNSFNEDEFACQLNAILCDMLLQSTAPLHQISTCIHYSQHLPSAHVNALNHAASAIYAAL